MKITLTNILRKEIPGHIHVTREELAELASMWRFVVFQDGSLFFADAHDALHQDIVRLDDKKRGLGLYCGLMHVSADCLKVVYVQGPRVDLKEVFRNFTQLEMFAGSARVIYPEELFDADSPWAWSKEGIR